MIILKDKNLKLKTVRLADSRQLFNLIENNRSHIGEWLNFIEDIKSLEDEKREIKNWIKKEKNGENIIFGIWIKKNLAGIISLEYITDVHKNAEIGYWLDKNYQGMGIMTSACRLVIDYAFNKLKLHRLEIYCATKNDKSYGVAKRLGFKEEGIARQSGFINGKFMDHYFFSILEHEWKSTN